MAIWSEFQAPGFSLRRDLQQMSFGAPAPRLNGEDDAVLANSGSRMQG
jgi:hypothetical protein